MNAGGTWPAVLACTQSLARSLPSLGDKVEAGPDGVAATLRQVPTVDPSQYPEFESPLMAAKERLSQRRRAEDAVADTQACIEGGSRGRMYPPRVMYMHVR